MRPSLSISMLVGLWSIGVDAQSVISNPSGSWKRLSGMRTGSSADVWADGDCDTAEGCGSNASRTARMMLRDNRYGRFIWGLRGYAGIFSSRCAFSQTIFRKVSGDADFLSTPSVSRATHVPASRAAAGLLAWLTPAPWPSAQLQSLPIISLSWCRGRKAGVNAGSRDKALLPEFAEQSPYRFG